MNDLAKTKGSNHIKERCEAAVLLLNDIKSYQTSFLLLADVGISTIANCWWDKWNGTFYREIKGAKLNKDANAPEAISYTR